MKWIAPHGATTPTERYVNAQPTIAGSNPDAKFFNDVLDELLAVITTANLTPSDTNLHQISDAIVYLTERAATSGVIKGSFWFGKTTANFTVPAPTAMGQTYIDFTNLNMYISNNGSTWTQNGTFVKPEGIDFTILITSKFWDIVDQTDQQGGDAIYSHSTDSWTYWPKIVNLDNAANRDLSNLSNVGQNIGNWSSNVTNCIIKIPQDIKLELAANGTLTLKAGSKVYVPNGSGTFDTVTTTADVSTTRTDTNKCMVWRYSNGSLGIFPISLFYSGPTAPTQYTFMFWYDTTENKCKYTSNGGSKWTSGASFPLCIVSTDGTKISAIDQVFNGFGYVGSTVFVLPGVKGLAPDGRNADGTLKNRVCSNSIVHITNDLTSNRGYTCGIITNGTITLFLDPKEYVQEDYPGGATYWCWYRPSENKIYNTQTSAGTQVQNVCAVLFYIKTSGGKIESLTPKTAFHAVDYNDFQKTAEQVNTNTTNIATLGTSKANTSLNNVSAGIDFVVESQLPTAQNNYTWYRKYKSGWVEQGQYVSTANTTITFPVPMANTDYMLVGVGFVISNQGAQQIAAKTTTGFQTASDMHISGTNGYYCCGMAA